VTGREVPGSWEEKLSSLKRLTFIPTPHIGPYLVGLIGDTQARILFGAQPPRGAAADAGTKGAAPSMSRSELLVRLNMLGDDVRLQILELLVQEDELCAQEIISRLELSQSSASRHLAQLTATGYIKERRREVNKCYSLNRARVDDTLAALRTFFEKR
jgi:DNA-binding transcriptional ArsR family regulator